MYSASSRDLAARAGLTSSRVIVDLCGGTGTTAEAILALAPPDATIVSLDSSAAMQSIGRRLLTDPRLTWVNAPAEDLTDHVPARSVDAVVCNSALWKTNVAAVVTAVRRVLRPGGRFVFNIGGVFAGVTHPDAQVPPAGPSLSALIQQIATRDYSIVPGTSAIPPKLPLPVITRLLADAGLDVVAAEVTGQRTTTAERAAWLSLPVFAHPEGALSYEQKMAILTEATAQTRRLHGDELARGRRRAPGGAGVTQTSCTPASSAAAYSLPVSRQRLGLPVAEGSPDSGRCGDRPRDPRSDEALCQIQRVPGGAGHLGLLDASDLGVGRREGIADVQVVVVRLVLRGPGRHLAELDIGGMHRDGDDLPGVDAGLLGQLPHGCADQRRIGRFKMPAWPPARVRGISDGVSEEHACQPQQGSRVGGGFLGYLGRPGAVRHVRIKAGEPTCLTNSSGIVRHGRAPNDSSETFGMPVRRVSTETLPPWAGLLPTNRPDESRTALGVPDISMASRGPQCLNTAVVMNVGELLAAYDRSLRSPDSAHPRFGTVVERIGPLTLTHHGTHCIVDHPALDASISTAQLASQVQQCAAARVEPVEWRVFAHDTEASRLTASLEAAGFSAGWERSVLVGEVAELDFPQPQPQPEWGIESVRWDEAQAQQALDLSAGSGPHRVPLSVWHAMGSIPYWDVDVRVLTHRGRVAAACWLETIRGTGFAAVGGLTASRAELLAKLPLWRFQPPAKGFLVAEADRQLRSALVAVGFRDVTMVRSHRWTPPGEPAAAPPARHSLHDAESGRIARRGEARIGFDHASGSGRYTAPLDSRRWFYGMLDRGAPAISAAEGVIERGLRACVRPGERVYECRPYLNGWEFDPHRVGGPGQPPWPGSAIADDEFQFLVTADARLGTFAHYAEQALVVFGDDLIEQVVNDLDQLLGDGVWTFG